MRVTRNYTASISEASEHHRHQDETLPIEEILETREQIEEERSEAVNSSPDLFSSRVGLFLGNAPRGTYPEIPSFFRGDSRDLTCAFNNDLISRGTNTNLLLHALPTGGEHYLIDSAYIPASESKITAARFPMFSEFLGENSYVYEIHTNRSAIDVIKTLAPKVTEGLLDPTDFSICIREKEMAFPFRISSNEIKGGWEIKKFHGIHSDYATQMTPELFISNPNYIAPIQSEPRLWSTCRTLGHSLTIVGLTVDGISLTREYQMSRISGNYNNTLRKSAEIVGGWAGAYAGGVVGAKMGAAVGAPFTPIASGVGAVLAALIGSVWGYRKGSSIATQVYDINRIEQVKPSRESRPYFSSTLNTNRVQLPSITQAFSSSLISTSINTMLPTYTAMDLFERSHGMVEIEASQTLNGAMQNLVNAHSLTLDTDIGSRTSSGDRPSTSTSTSIITRMLSRPTSTPLRNVENETSSQALVVSGSQPSVSGRSSQVVQTTLSPFNLEQAWAALSNSSRPVQQAREWTPANYLSIVQPLNDHTDVDTQRFTALSARSAQALANLASATTQIRTPQASYTPSLFPTGQPATYLFNEAARQLYAPGLHSFFYEEPKALSVAEYLNGESTGSDHVFNADSEYSFLNNAEGSFDMAHGENQFFC